MDVENAGLMKRKNRHDKSTKEMKKHDGNGLEAKKDLVCQDSYHAFVKIHFAPKNLAINQSSLSYYITSSRN
jgi:NADPH-dependent 7-cyano-7-deazaguanine reductase QueF